MRRGLQPGRAELVVIMPQPVTQCCQGGGPEIASAATAAAQSNVSNSCASSGAKTGSSPWKPPDAASGGAAPAATSTTFAPVLLWSPSATSSCKCPAPRASFAFSPGSAPSECKRGHHQAQGTTQLDIPVLHSCNMGCMARHDSKLFPPCLHGFQHGHRYCPKSTDGFSKSASLSLR